MNAANDAPDPELPRGVALAWGVTANPQRGPKRELSIERIVDAAIEIADAEGLAAVSMSRVAASLGFTTMSLYRYVTSKDDLTLLMQEAASEVPVPEPDEQRGWRSGLRQWVLSIRAAYREHPWLVDVPISGAPITPNSLTIVDWFLREVRPLPLSDGEKMSALLLLTSYTRAVGAQERDLAAAAAAADDPNVVDGTGYAAALAELVTAERFPDFEPLFAAGGYLADPLEDEGDDFAFGLERILDGIERHVDRVGTTRRPRADVPTDVAALEEPDARPLPRDPRVRDANRARRDAEKAVREAEKALREARKREREEIKRVREREREQERRERERPS